MFISKKLKNKQRIQLYGLNHKTIESINKKVGINIRKKYIGLKTPLKKEQEQKKLLKKYTIGKKLQIQKKKINSFLIEWKMYRGLRNKLGYPSRGQRTHTNAKTKKKLKLQNGKETNTKEIFKKHKTVTKKTTAKKKGRAV